MNFHYDTVLLKADDHLFAFYKYNNGIGFVPGDVSFTYRGKLYTTADMMVLLADAYKKRCHPNKDWSIHHWYDERGVLKTRNFVNAVKALINKTG